MSGRSGPETIGLIRLRELMHERGWLTLKTHGNAFQEGLPDLLCFHPTRGIRLVEVKTEKGRFTPAQLTTFHKISGHGGMIWVLIVTDPPENNHLISQISLLDKRPNWTFYLEKMG